MGEVKRLIQVSSHPRRYFSQFLRSIESDFPSIDSYETHKTDDPQGALRSDERILIAPVARMHHSSVHPLKYEDRSSDPKLASPSGAGQFRKSSPIVAAVVSNRVSPQLKSEDMTDVSMETLLRVSFTEFHNNPNYADDNKSAYLGEELSLHRANMLTAKNYKQQTKMLRATSLEGLHRNEKKPCLMAMPPTLPHTSLGESLEKISPFSWIVPYIVSCLPPELLRALMETTKKVS